MFDETILRTKVLPPALRATCIPRPQLTQKLRQAQTVKLTLVSAPAGFGKSTAVAAALATYADETDVATAWLALEERDNDPLRFWRYFLAALDTAVGPAFEPLAALSESLAAPQPPPTHALLGGLLNALARQPRHIILVLDDLHCIDRSDIHEGLAFVLDHAPATLHLVLVTRADPPLALHQLRAGGQLIEVRAGNLRFDHTETAVFLRQVMGLELSVAEIDALSRETEGWAVGLQLAGLALQGNPAARRDIIAGLSHDNRYILEYLTEEVLARQPQPVQAFLLQTAILGRLCGPLCDAVVQTVGSGALLKELERQNLFLLPTGRQDANWFRYHHLFAMLLQGLLQRQYPERVPVLHGRAARWFAAQGDIEAALDHAFQAREYAMAAALLDEHADTFVMQGRARTVEDWLVQLPPAFLEDVPRANVAFARTLLLRGRFADVEPYLLRAEGSRRAASDPVFQGETHALRATLADTLGQAETALTHARRALEVIPDGDVLARALAQFALAGALREQGDAASAADAYEQAIPLCRAARLALPEMLARAHLGFLCVLQGQLHRAATVTRPAVETGLQHPAAAAAMASLAMVYLEWQQFEEARRLLQQAQALVGEGGHSAAAVHIQILNGRLLRAQGDLEGAQRALEDATVLFERGVPAWLEPLLRAQQVLQRLALDAEVVTLDSVTEASVQGGEQVPVHLRPFVPLALARACLQSPAGCDLNRALALLNGVLDTAGEQGLHGFAIEARMLRALAHAALGEVRAARLELGQALAQAEPEGYVQLFVEGGAPLAALLADMSRPYARRLLEAFPAEMRPVLRPLAPEQLTEREREVLQLMGRGLTYRQIADDLFVSVNTVRHHVKGLYGKLQVSSRAQAVAKARELGLL